MCESWLITAEGILKASMLCSINAICAMKRSEPLPELQHNGWVHCKQPGELILRSNGMMRKDAKPMLKPLLLLTLLPISACTFIEVTDKTFKVVQTLASNQPVKLECTSSESKTASTYTINPNKDDVIVEVWNEDQPKLQSKLKSGTERKPLAMIENISRVSQNKDKQRGPMKVEVNIAFDRVILSKTSHQADLTRKPCTAQ